MMDQHSNRPLSILRVLPRDDDRTRKPGGGSGPKYFQPYSPDLRRNFEERVHAIHLALRDRGRYSEKIPSVGKLRLHPDALSKTRRPTVLFNEKTCPVIGASDLGELYLSVTESGLVALEKMVSAPQLSPAVEAAITAVGDFSLRVPTDSIQGTTDSLIGCPLRALMFDFENDIHNGYMQQALRRLLQEMDIKVLRETRYTDTLIVRRILCSTEEQVNAILDFGGLRSLQPMPRYSLSSSHLDGVEVLSDGFSFPTPTPGKDYPIVGLLDSGIPLGHRQLGPWVCDREDFVAEPYKNNRHGCFVGGILVNGGTLGGSPRIGDGVKLLDITLLPNNDPRVGSVDAIDEDDLVDILNEVVRNHRTRVRVWNLSIETGELCELSRFSPLGVALDGIQDRHKVLIVKASGNYKNKPLRSWPSDVSDGSDRITTGGDSVLGITVGAIADGKSSGSVRPKVPAPFSRRGPAPAYLVKPDVVHYGGNCTLDGDDSKLGVVSVGPAGEPTIGAGTSYSTPMVSGLAAHVFHALTTERYISPSVDLVKALLIHSASHPETGGPVQSKEDAYYFGFGLPSTLSSILSCTRHSATMIFEGQLTATSNKISIRDFPFPQCLIRSGKCYGEIRATLVYAPPLIYQFGPEYCRANIDVSIGTMYCDKGKARPTLHGQVDLEAAAGHNSEEDMVKHGFKWSPVKKYYGRFSGIKQNPWGLSVSLLDRDRHTTTTPLPFTLIITVTDPTGNEDVYTDIVQQLAQRFEYMSLPIRESVRVQLGLDS